MTRSLLPKNYTKPGVTLEGFENMADWVITASGSSTAQANMSQKHTGAQSIKLMTDIVNPVTITRTYASNQSITGYSIVLWIYLHSNGDSLSSMTIDLASSTNLSNKLTISARRFPTSNQWWPLYIYKDDLTAVGTETWATLLSAGLKVLQIMLTQASGQQAICSVDDLQLGGDGLPRVMLHFDDGYQSTYDIAYPYMATWGVKGNSMIISSYVQGSNPSYMRLAQLQTLYAAGWAIGNHTTDHTNLTTLSTQAEMEAKILPCTEYLLTNGLTRGAYHLVYPYGARNATVIAAARNAGILTARSGLSGVVKESHLALELPCVTCADGISSLNTVRSAIQEAITKGHTLILLFHKIVASGPVNEEASTAYFQAIIQYLVDAKIPVVTIDEWYKGLINPRYRSLSLSRAVV